MDDKRKKIKSENINCDICGKEMSSLGVCLDCDNVHIKRETRAVSLDEIKQIFPDITDRYYE